MVATLFDDLTTGRKRLPEDWIAGQFKALDRTDGEIDSLAAGCRACAPCPTSPTARLAGQSRPLAGH
jgi:hypothetical protein